MNTLYPDIKTKNWQLSTVGVGYIAEGLADIRQCLDILLRTVKGSVPLYPEFGCDIYKFADKPLNFAIPNIKRSIIEAIEIWEKRVTLKKVTHEISTDNLGQVDFQVTVALNDDELIDLILFYKNGGFISIESVDSGSLTLYALFPPNPKGNFYNISFEGNGGVVLPTPPAYGFDSIASLFSWVQINWGRYGRWQLSSDRITCFVKPGLFTTGSLTMSLVANNKFTAPIPLATIGQNYSLTFIPDGVAASPAPPASFVTIAEMVAWVNANWSDYGKWQSDGSPYNNTGDFLVGDFDSEDFDIGALGEYILILYDSKVETCTLEVNVV